MYKQLLTSIAPRTARIGVIGLGYVGLPLALEWARAGFQVTGIDIDPQRVALCKKGKSWISDISSDDLSILVREGRLTATTETAILAELYAVSICVPTPLNKTKDPDIGPVLNAVNAIVTHLHQGLLIVLESTTYPGTTDELILPCLNQAGLTVGEDFILAFSHERIDPNNKQYSL